MFDMMKMMGKVKEVQAKMKEAQENLVHIKANGESGGGMVKATVNGKKILISLDIDPILLKADDKMVLQDLVVAAVNKASEEADILAKEEIRKSTDGLLPNIPGMDLSSMLG
jgi:nucleoid-associated protein EbfC